MVGGGRPPLRPAREPLLEGAPPGRAHPRLLAPDEEGELAALGLGITNLVERATAGAAELGPGELRAGGARLTAKAAARQA